MKLMRYGAKGAEKPGLVDAQGKVRGLSGVIPDITAQTLSAQGLAQLRALDVVEAAAGRKARAASHRRGAAAASSCASA